MHVPKAEYEAILKEISSDASPVGIDARHTHILILHKLMQIERRLAAIEIEIARGVRDQGDD